MFFLEREGTTNKPRRARHWFTRRCGRCLSNTDSVHSSMSSIAQYMPETPTHNSTQNLSSGANGNESNTQSSTVIDLSSSQGHLEGDNIHLQELRTNCENHTSTASLKSISSQGYMSPYEERKSFTHQVVVVAPITGKLLLISVFIVFSPGQTRENSRRLSRKIWTGSNSMRAHGSRRECLRVSGRTRASA